MYFFLFEDISKTYDQFVKIIDSIPISKRYDKEIEGTGGKINIADLIAYQIGWGKCLIRWYEAGIKGELPAMPGDGFLKWDYLAISEHFYARYRYDGFSRQMMVFKEVVSRILEIVKEEQNAGNLDREGVWSWCTLSSGKKWPLGKWIQINTVSPWSRGIRLLKKLL